MEIRRRQFVALKLEMLVIYIQNSPHNHCKFMLFFFIRNKEQLRITLSLLNFKRYFMLMWLLQRINWMIANEHVWRYFISLLFYFFSKNTMKLRKIIVFFKQISSLFQQKLIVLRKKNALDSNGLQLCHLNCWQTANLSCTRVRKFILIHWSWNINNNNTLSMENKNNSCLGLFLVDKL